MHQDAAEEEVSTRRAAQQTESQTPVFGTFIPLFLRVLSSQRSRLTHLQQLLLGNSSHPHVHLI